MGPRALATAAGVSTDSLRHYERLGLLSGVERTGGGYRRYPPGAVDRVKLIQRALAIGFSLKELASVLRNRDAGEPPCHRVRALVGDRLNALDRRLAELTALREQMRALLRDWDRRLASTPPGHRARLLDRLAGNLERMPRPSGSLSRNRRGRSLG
jgi:DNA-binding transcriptional MerR regulator